MAKIIPPRPDIDQLRKRKRYRGKELVIRIASKDGDVSKDNCVTERVQFRSDYKNLVKIYGKKAVASAKTISKGEIEITVEVRDQIVDYIAHLERHIDPKWIALPTLSKIQGKMVAIDVSAWIEGLRPLKDKRKKSSDGYFPPWSAVEIRARELGVEQKTLGRWHKLQIYRRAFIDGCNRKLQNDSGQNS